MPRGRTGEELARGPNAASGKGASPGSKTRGRGKREAPGNRGSGRPQPQGRGRGAPTARPLLSETPAADEPDAGPAGHAGTPGWTLPATPRRSWSLSCSAEGPRGQARGRSLSETRPLAPPAGSGLRVPGRGEARAQRAVGGRRQTPRPRLRQETQARGAPISSWRTAGWVGRVPVRTAAWQGPSEAPAWLSRPRPAHTQPAGLGSPARVWRGPPRGVTADGPHRASRKLAVKHTHC